MKSKRFRCPNCNKDTLHKNAGTKRIAEKRSDGITQKICGSILDCLGITRLLDKIYGERTWECSECGSVYLRDRKGNIRHRVI